MSILAGYLLAFSILTWSLANISQFLDSREALSRRLKNLGAQFLAEIGEADMKDQSYRQMAKVMTEVSNSFMEELAKVEPRTPLTTEEIRGYIISTMGITATPTETEIMDYLKKATKVVHLEPEEDSEYGLLEGSMQ